MEKEENQVVAKVPNQMIVEYTKECVQKQLQQKLRPDVRSFIENIQNWDLHHPNSPTQAGGNLESQKEEDFIVAVIDSGVLGLIKSTKAKTLFLFQHRSKEILKAIIHPCYEKLKWLSLSNNKIDNIEAIAFLDAPVLQRLDLNGNKIITPKPLNKTTFKHLNRLNIQTNPIKSLDLSRGQWAQEIQSFHIEGRKNAYVDDKRYESSGPLEWIFKLNSQKAKIINTRWSCRIKQLNLLPQISQRFNQEKSHWPIFDH